MKKKFFAIILPTVMLLIFASCSNVLETLGFNSNGTLKVTLPSSGRAAVNVNDIETYTLVLSGDETYTETGTAGSTISFVNIEQGTYTLTGSAYDNSGNRLAYNSQSIKITGGVVKSIDFTLYTTPPIALWSSITDTTGNTTYSAYVTDTGANSFEGLNATATGLYSNAIEFDSDRNLYTICTDKIIQVCNAPKYGTSTLISNDASCNGDMYYSDDGLLYYTTATYDNTKYTYALSICNTKNLNIEDFSMSLTNDFKIAATSFTDKAYLYTANISYSNSIYTLSITPYTITLKDNLYTATAAETVYSSTLSDLNLSLATSYGDSTTVLNGICSPTVTDIAISGSYLYVLVSCTPSSYFYKWNNYNNSSCGALLRFKISGTSVTLDASFGNGGILGWTNGITSYGTITNANNGTNTYYFQIPTDEANAFFGPAKILAIKPKKIWIADDGATYNTSTSTIEQKDRVVVIDLEKQTFESVIPTSSDITFDNTIDFYN